MEFTTEEKNVLCIALRGELTHYINLQHDSEPHEWTYDYCERKIDILVDLERRIAFS